MDNAVISVITPVYNAEKYIKDTIESVLNQSFSDFEFLLIDDCSTDNSQNILKKYEKLDNRIKFLKLNSNSGAAVARNKGLEKASGKYIAFIDSDDRWYPKKLELQLAYMRNENYGFTYTKFEMINPEGKVKKSPADLPKKLDYKGLLKNTAIACSTVMIDKEIVGDFRMPLVRKGQDTATWLKILREQHDYAYLLDETLNQYRIVEGSLSSNKIGALKRTWNTYKNLENLALPKALYYFAHSVMNAVLRRL